ncbi:MAG: Rieske Fe-S protein [Hydrogenophaga sp.]|jgi:Rieske Fe-S protein
MSDIVPSDCPTTPATRHAPSSPELFVALGICTHLGCSPNKAPAGAANPSLPADWPGGFF